ncbi:hypothetical protein RFI_40026, partial [Reticulomyxa filosa]
NECKITLPMKISSSFDTNVHVIDGSNANYKIQKMHVNTNVRKLQLFEKQRREKLNEINWNDIWSFEQFRNNVFIRSNSISSIKIDVNTTTKELIAYNDTLIKDFGKFTENLQKLTQDNQKWIH